MKEAVLIFLLFFSTTDSKAVLSLNPGDVPLVNIGETITGVIGDAIVGGLGEWLPATDEIQSICDQLRNQVEAQMNRLTPFTKYLSLTYRSQIVAGTNYNIRIDVGEDKYLEISVFESLPLPQSTLSLNDVQWVDDVNRDDEPSINLGESITGVIGNNVVGGFGEWLPATDEIQSICDQLRNQVEAQMNRLSPFTKYLSVSYRSQIVAGTNYNIRINVGEEKYLEISVFQSLPLQNSSLSLNDVQWVDDVNDTQHMDVEENIERKGILQCFMLEFLNNFKREEILYQIPYLQ